VYTYVRVRCNTTYSATAAVIMITAIDIDSDIIHTHQRPAFTNRVILAGPSWSVSDVRCD